MTLIERSVGISSPAGEVLQKIYLHKRLEFEIGTGGKGLADPFQGTESRWAYPLHEAIRKAEERYRDCRLLLGIGTASTRRGFGDLTALDADGHYLDVQGFFGRPPHASPISWVRASMGSAGVEAPPIMLFPDSSLVFATSELRPNYEGETFSGYTNKNAGFKELIDEVCKEVNPGRVFAVIFGEIERVVFRPLKPEGPTGKPLNVSKSPESNVVWINSPRSFRASIVACFDSSSWLEAHAHCISTMQVFCGGHIANAVVRKGAEIVLFKASETVSVGPDTPGAISHQYIERSSSCE